MNQLSEQGILQEISQRLKSGDFSAKEDLFQLMNQTEDLQIQSDCIALFAAVASNEDFDDPQKFFFLENADADIVHAFVSDSALMLSYGVVPYLLVLLEEWQDSANEESIRSSLDFILSYSDHMDFNASLEEIEGLAYEIISNVDKSKYYYMNREFHPSILAKNISEVAQARLANQEEFQMYIPPKLLSNASGKDFPVDYFDKIDEGAFRSIYSFIKELIPIEWEEGAKYYYGNKVQ